MPANSGEKGGSSAPASPGAVFDLLELAPPLRRVYQAALKVGDVSLEELQKELGGEAPEELRIYLNLLSRLGYLEKRAESGGMRFRVKGRVMGRSSLPGEIWDKLDAKGGSGRKE